MTTGYFKFQYSCRKRRWVVTWNTSVYSTVNLCCKCTLRDFTRRDWYCLAWTLLTRFLCSQSSFGTNTWTGIRISTLLLLIPYFFKYRNFHIVTQQKCDLTYIHWLNCLYTVTLYRVDNVPGHRVTPPIRKTHPGPRCRVGVDGKWLTHWSVSNKLHTLKQRGFQFYLIL